MNLADLINRKVKEMDESGRIEKIIEEKTGVMIEFVFKEIFSSYGPLVEELKQDIESKLKIDLSRLDIPTYNEQMLSGVKTAMSNAFVGSASDKLNEELDDLFGNAPETMNIRELVDTILNFWREENYRNYDRMHIEFEENDRALKGSYNLYLYENGDDTRSSERKNLYINEEGKIRISHAHNYNPTCLHKDDALIFKLYAAGTKLTGLEAFDPDQVDVYYNNHEY